MTKKFDATKEPIDVLRLKDLVLTAETSKKELENTKALLDSVLNISFQSMPNGFPFSCSRCKFEGFTVDFITLGLSHCPNCNYQGYVTIRQSSPVPLTKDSLQSIGVQMKVVWEWYNSLAEKPSLVTPAFQEVVSQLQRAGLYR